MKVYFKIVLVSTLFLLSVFSSFAQITINNTGYTPTQLVDGVLVPTGSGTTISNVVFRGVYNNSSRYQVGYFSTATTTLAQLGFTNGVVLSTGNTATIPLTLGSNPRATQMATAYTSGTPGELRQTGTPAPPIIQDLDVLAGASNYFNGAILEFDFVPVENSVSFRYIFGSEEYSDNTGSINYQCSTYNDKFGFLISGPGIVGGQGFTNNARNIARLANGSEVSINSVNSGVVGSSGGAPSTATCLAANGSWVQNTPTAEYLGTIDGTQLNGNTRILTATQTSLTPGQTYHIKLIITDVGDATYDSVVYLEAGSFTTESTCNAGPDQSLCAVTSATLAAVSPATGTWTVVSGSGTFVSNSNPNTTVNGLSNGVNVFRWTASDLSCSSDVTITISPNVTPTFTAVAPICSGATLSALPTTSTNGINGTWSPALNNTTTTTYTFTPTAGQCATTTTLTITVNPNVTPTFASVAAICSGASLLALPTTSTNGINGTWSPALNNTTTTIYTFTPTAGQCATNTTLTITVTPNVTPTFTAVAPICSGATLSALPTTSTNGITGTWSPALNNTSTTTYTFTPTAGQCATTTTMSITVTPNVTPTFTAVAPICSGATLSALPTTSTNGITGTWSPALNNTVTTTYIFTPTAGQCTTTTTLTITVTPNVTPTFTAVASICSGTALAALPTTSINGITGTWSPALNNTTTTTYTFTPTAGQCATTTTMTIIVNPTPVLTVSCGVSTASSVTFNWNAIADATSYSYSYSVNGGPSVTGSLSNATTTFTINSLAAGQNVSITITPVGSLCAQPATSNCVSSNCPTPIVNTVGNISACSNATILAINFTSPSAGVTFTWTNTNTLIGLGASGTGNIPSFTAANVTTQQVATIAVTANDGACSGPSMFFTITINPNVTPTFTAVTPICSGATLSALPTTSTNGITGTWSPALNNTATTIYTFTPTAGQCATTTTLTITVNPNVTPTFTAVAPICSGTALAALPTTSTNGITGTWSPALNNTTTTTYTFTPTAGQCATNTTLTITVTPNVTPTFTAVAPICSGATLSALPTTSTNGITGTWSPALNNTSTTTYTFTPTAGQCATTTTMSITVTPNVTPTFTAVAPICSGATLSALPTTSTNGITGTWSPALNNTVTTTYIFTPTAGQCATTTTLTITVTPNVTPTFPAVAPICSGTALAALPTTSTNGITGTWSPALNNTTTTTYTFTPTAGQCATTTTMTITVNPTPVLTVSCGVSTASSVTFNWNAIADATSYSYSYSVNGGPSVTGSLSNATSTFTINSLAAGQNVSITITPVGSLCAQPATSNCVSSNCPTPIVDSVGNISACSNATISAINFTSPSAGVTFTWTNTNPLIGLGASGTGSIPSFTAANLATQQVATIAVTANDGACSGPSMFFTITVNPNVTPNFASVAAICSGASLSALPTISTNGINGTWSPALNNTATTTYTFTPTAGQCATTTTLTITVNPNVTPTFASVAAICSGATLSPLPTTSTNGINGTWSPALNNTTTTIYTFTPTAGQCATTTTLTITVNPNVTPTFASVAPICSGATLSALPTTSTNGINGTWSPALNNSSTTVYTFTPTVGQCATTTTLTITVNPEVTPTFVAVSPICSGATLSALPTTSTNGINGSWSPALDNTVTTTYTFTPTVGQCATNTTLTITVNPNVTPTFASVAAICSGTTLSALPTTSTNGINGTWSPALNNTATTTYTFTPTAGQCATTTTLTITVNPNVTPNFASVAAICSGASLSALPTTSTNGINGTWSPALNNTTTTTYTFTPTAGQCATTTTLTITVNPNVIPTFASVAAICSGATLSPLPTTSTNGINGTWSPALNNTATTTYTFTPTAGQCATLTTMTIIVNETPVVSITEGCNGVVYELSAIVSSGVATYEWFNSSSVSLGTTPTISITSTGTYEVRVSLNGCTVSDFITVDNAFCMIPKGISPNNDGDNDSWDLSNLNVETAQIFNRYGVEVYSKNNYTDEWDGRTDSGEELPTATYYYVLTFPNGVVKTGWVYLNRVN